MAAGVKCTNNHESSERQILHSHEHQDSPGLLNPQSRMSLTNNGGYNARVQIREDLHGRKQAHAMAICDCNGQGKYDVIK